MLSVIASGLLCISMLPVVLSCKFYGNKEKKDCAQEVNR